MIGSIVMVLLHSEPVVLLNEIQPCHSSYCLAPLRSPVFAGLGLRSVRRVTGYLSDATTGFHLSSTDCTRVPLFDPTDNKLTQLSFGIFTGYRNSMIQVKQERKKAIRPSRKEQQLTRKGKYRRNK